MIFFIDLGLCLLAFLRTKILFLCFFPFAMIFMPMSQCKGFLYIWTTSFIFFFTFLYTLLLPFFVYACSMRIICFFGALGLKFELVHCKYAKILIPILGVWGA